MAKLDFFFDPGCPWTWITSRWVTEVAPHRDLQVTWRPFSLAMKNQGIEFPPGFPQRINEQIMALGTVVPGALRVLEAVRATHGE